LATLSCRPLRTSCWIVGTASPSSVSCCAVCSFSACSAPRLAARLWRARAATCVAYTDCGLSPDPRARACRRFHDAPGPPENGPD